MATARTAAAVVAAALLAVSGCASGAEPGPPTESVTETPVPAGKLTVWDATGAGYDPAATYAPVIESFRADYPAVEVEVIGVDPARAREGFLAASRAGDPPALLLGPSEWTVELAGGGFLEPLTGTPLEVALADYVPVTRSSVEFGQELWGLPQTSFSDALVCNERVLSSAQATVPGTWSEVAAESGKLAAAGVTLLLAPATGTDALPYLYSAGGGMLDTASTTILVNNPESTAGWEQAVALIASGATPRSLPGTPAGAGAPDVDAGSASASPAEPAATDPAAQPTTGPAEAREAFLRGDLACLFADPFETAGIYADARATTDVSISVNPPPAGSAPGSATAQGANLNVAAAADQSQKELGYLFAAHLNSVEVQFDLALAAGWPPAQAASNRLLADQTTAQAKILNEYAPLTRSAAPWPATPELPALIPALDAGWAAMAAGSGAPAQVADDIAAQWQTVLPATYSRD
ncbi:MAG: extracellular solute-binding protein [Actinobacteria bacterium]|nr:extracellular solute-binding protein [Actinomycetota bacterium]MCB9411790.1 extracellular solute-binding protein [Actinomycetota bacterium]